jgi:hypothetical protein
MLVDVLWVDGQCSAEPFFDSESPIALADVAVDQGLYISF